MCEHGVIVLKLGGSVLRDEGSLDAGVAEIRRWRLAGYAVVAVVSALAGETERLIGHARRVGGECDDARATAALVATGELASAAMLSLALGRAGIGARVFDAATIGLRTSGPVGDAEPVALDPQPLRRALHDGLVGVIPGFIGRDEEGHTALLGRGGSDLTAIFVAARLGAERCRLVKDVDGLCQSDPSAVSAPVRRYETIDWAGALLLGGGVVQDKAIRLAWRHRLPFEVGALGRDDATRVGDVPVVLRAIDRDGPLGSLDERLGRPPTAPNRGFRGIALASAANRGT
jgi:homoserine dehydrogenase